VELKTSDALFLSISLKVQQKEKLVIAEGYKTLLRVKKIQLSNCAIWKE
jgi:hypothetical protein